MLIIFTYYIILEMTKKIFRPPLFFYKKFIKSQREGVSFVIFFFFLLTFVFSRLWVYLAIQDIVPLSLTQNVRGVHIHHFAYGIFINTIVGYLIFILPRHLFEKWKLRLAAFFGIGMGWTFDEFGMWLRLKDEYWLRQSYDAVIILAIIFINIVYLGNIWKKLTVKTFRRLRLIRY